MRKGRALRLVGLAAAAAGAAGGIALFCLWRSIHAGALLEPESLAGPDTVLLVSFTLRGDDPGVVAALGRLRQMESRRRHSRLPLWARWLLTGGTEKAPSLQAAALMPVRLVASVDCTAEGHESRCLVVSLSRYSERIESALAAAPLREAGDVPVAEPRRPGEPYAAVLRNNVLLSTDEKSLGALIQRLREGGGATSELFRSASRATPPGGDGLALLLNPGDRLERMAREALEGYGIELGTLGQPSRLLPLDLLASGFSLDLLNADEARLEGTVLFADRSAAAEGERVLRRGLPVSLALLGLESEFRLRHDGERLLVTGTLRGLDAIWDRLLAGRFFR